MIDLRMVTMTAEQARLLSEEREAILVRRRSRKTIRAINRIIAHRVKEGQCSYSGEVNDEQIDELSLLDKTYIIQHFQQQGYTIDLFKYRHCVTFGCAWYCLGITISW